MGCKERERNQVLGEWEENTSKNEPELPRFAYSDRSKLEESCRWRKDGNARGKPCRIDQGPLDQTRNTLVRDSST